MPPVEQVCTNCRFLKLKKDKGTDTDGVPYFRYKHWCSKHKFRLTWQQAEVLVCPSFKENTN